MAAIPAHSFEGRGALESTVNLELTFFLDHIPSVLIKYNRFAPNWIPASEIANPENLINQIRRRDTRNRFCAPCDLIAVNILKDNRRSPSFYVPGVIIAKVEVM